MGGSTGLSTCFNIASLVDPHTATGIGSWLLFHGLVCGNSMYVMCGSRWGASKVRCQNQQGATTGMHG